MTMNHYYIVKWEERRKDGYICSRERLFNNEQEQIKFWFDLHHNEQVIWICKTTEIITEKD